MAGTGARRRIVVVDDDGAVLRMVRRQLDSLGWEAHLAATPFDALSLLHRLENVEVLLTDVDMPAMDGVALRHEVVTRFPHTAVVLMSGAASPRVIKSLPARLAFLRKPFTRQALAAVLDQALSASGGR